MSKLKVVQLLPELNTGGVERGATDLSNELVRRGHTSFVISNGGRFEKKITKISSELELDVAPFKDAIKCVY